MELTDAVKKYVVANTTRRLSKQTIAKDNTVINSFIAWSNDKGLYLVDEISSHLVRDYIVHLRSSIKNISVNGYRTILQAFFKWCQAQGYTTKNLFLTIPRLKEPKPLPAYVPMLEMETLFESFENTSTLSVTQIIIFEFFYATGIRTTELIDLDITDVDLKDNIVNVRHGKGDQQRFVPFPGSLVPVIRRYLQIREQHHFASPYLFPNAHGARLHRSAAYRLIKEILDTTTSKKKGAHTIRHSYASHLLARGANLKAIADLLGHRSTRTTVKYTHLDIDSKRAIFKKAHPKA